MYEELSTNEIVTLYQRDTENKALLSIIIARMRPAFESLSAQQARYGNVEYDDAMQECMLIACDAARRFDASKGFAFENYCAACARNRLHDMAYNSRGVSHFDAEMCTHLRNEWANSLVKGVRFADFIAEHPLLSKAKKEHLLSIIRLSGVMKVSLDSLVETSEGSDFSWMANAKSDDGLYVGAETAEVEKAVVEREVIKVLHEQIEKLAPDERFVIDQIYFKGKTEKEIDAIFPFERDRKGYSKDRYIRDVAASAKSKLRISCVNLGIIDAKTRKKQG